MSNTVSINSVTRRASIGLPTILSISNHEKDKYYLDTWKRRYTGYNLRITTIRWHFVRYPWAGSWAMRLTTRTTGRKEASVVLIISRSNKKKNRWNAFQQGHETTIADHDLLVLPSCLLFLLHTVDNFAVAKTIHCVIVDQPHSLHEGIANSGSDKIEASFLQRLAHLLRLRGPEVAETKRVIQEDGSPSQNGITDSLLNNRWVTSHDTGVEQNAILPIQAPKIAELWKTISGDRL